MLLARPTSAALWVSGRSINDPHVSPDGLSVAFTMSNGDDLVLAIAPAEGGAERWMPCDPPVRRGSGVLDWLPDGSGVVYLGSDGCVHLLDLATGACRPVTALGEPLSSLAVSPNGDAVAYVIDTAEVVVAPLEPGSVKTVRLSSGADFVFDPSWSPDGRSVVWHEWDVPDMPWDGSRICRRSADGSSPIEVVFDRAGAAAQPRYSPDGRWITFLSDVGGFMNVWSAPVDDVTAAAVLIPDDVEHAGPAWGPGARTYVWSPDSSFIYFSRNVGGWGSLWRFDVGSGERVRVGDGFHQALHASGDALAAVRKQSVGGSQLVSIDGESRSMTLMRSVPEHIGRGIEPELVEWTGDDEVTLHGRLYRPVGGGASPPLLVWVHGGPHGQSPVTSYARFGYFVERGWAVLSVDHRGSSGWGREFEQSLNGNWGVFDVADTIRAIDAAQRNGWGDPRRTVVYGASAGGFTSLLVGAQSNAVAAVVAMYPVCDLLAFDEDTWRFEAHYTERLVGALPEAREEYIRRSPLTVADQIAAPVLILHGDNDNVVPVAQSRTMVDRLTAVGRGVVELHVYEGEGHGWRSAATEADELERVHAFLRKYVLQDSDPNEEIQ